jgi:hypothetical protein
MKIWLDETLQLKNGVAQKSSRMLIDPTTKLNQGDCREAYSCCINEMQNSLFLGHAQGTAVFSNPFYIFAVIILRTCS